MLWATERSREAGCKEGTRTRKIERRANIFVKCFYEPGGGCQRKGREHAPGGCRMPRSNIAVGEERAEREMFIAETVGGRSNATAFGKQLEIVKIHNRDESRKERACR
eukprot:Gb_20969 [translate_table: standard]